MTSQELRQKFLEFFESKGHKVIPSASLIPENDPTVLFTTAGMQPLVPYLLTEPHPSGRRLTNSQKCLRTDDIEEIGDKVHHTFFEMLGNWSLGDYFKEEAIEFSFEFLTSPKCLGLEREKLAISVFEGDEDAPFDQEAYDKWVSLGISDERIAKLPKKNNWWGQVAGPSGPNTEMFYWSGRGKAPEKFDHEDETWVEIWNDVFMEFDKKRTIIIADALNSLIEKETNKLNLELAELLEGYNTQIIVASNAPEEKIRQVLGDFNFEIFTTNKKILKTDPAYYKKLLEKYDLKNNQVICFEFRKERAETAEKVGIKSIQYENPEGVREFIDANQYYYEKLKQKNVDTGMGLERMLALLNGHDDNYRTDVFWPIIEKISELSGKKYEGNEDSYRIIADHLRASVFAISDGAIPSNKGRGYVIRRLIRRAIVKAHQLGITDNFTADFTDVVQEIYKDVYELNTDKVKKELKSEEERFRKTLAQGLKIFERRIIGGMGTSAFGAGIPTETKKKNKESKIITGKDAFGLYQSFGFPFELTKELAVEKKLKIDEKGFQEEFKKHQELSRTASAGMFKGGLVDASEASTKYHTTAHLLLAGLQEVLGDHVHQKGSNITPERLRLDFSHPEKLTDEERKKVEDWVNDKIEKKLEVYLDECDVETAKKKGAEGEFVDKYGDKVRVYSIGGGLDSKDAVSKEICGGPHIKNTSELGHFRIKNETSSSKGVRRIKAVLES